MVIDNYFDFYHTFKDHPEFNDNVKFQQLMGLVLALLSFPCPCHVRGLISATGGAYGELATCLTDQDKANMKLITNQEQITIQSEGNLIISF